MKKYLLFDLDGTLSDPKVGICTCVQYALKSFGIEEPDLDKLEPFIGPPLKESFMKYYNLTDKQGDDAVAKYRERFSDVGLYENVIYPGIADLLKELSSKGYILAVASSKPTVYVKRILEHFKIEKYFKVVVGSELDGRRVNKAEVVREALRQLFDNGYVNRDEVYMIGDRCFDVEGAHALGIESVAVSYGYGSMEELKEAKSDYIVRSVRELRRFLLRGSYEVKKPNMWQRLIPIFMPYIVFLLVKSMAKNIVEFLLFYIGSGSAGIDFLVSKDAEGVITGVSANTSTIATAMGFIAAAAFFAKMAKRKIEEAADDMWITHLKPEPKKKYLLLAFSVIGCVIGLNLFFALTGGTTDEAYKTVAEIQYAASLPVGLVCYGLITPFAEELLFRGIIFNNVKKYMKPAFSLFISAAIFGLYHDNQIQGLYALALGALITYAYEYFGTFKVAVAIHMAANILSYLLTYIVEAVPGYNSWVVCIIGLFWAVGGVYFLNKEKQIY